MALSREFVDFYERDIPIMVQTLYTVLGALVMLGLYDRMLVVFCLAVVVPASALNYVYGRQAFLLNGGSMTNWNARSR